VTAPAPPYTVTYRVATPPAGEVTELLDDDWCRNAGYQPADVRTPVLAAWSLALLLGAHGNDDAELIRIEPAP
jgi:hypothetical protein